MSESEQSLGGAVTLFDISPMGGVMAGGLTVTINGRGIQEGCDVFFGVVPSPYVAVVGDGTTEIIDPPPGGSDDPPPNQPPGHIINITGLIAEVPPGTDPGSVTVTVVNPDGTTGTVEGGFTYFDTTPTDRVEVLGVTPLAVIENTATDITIRGRNLISAYNTGLVALRGPSRAVISTSNLRTSVDAATGIESLTVSVTVTATPALGSLERLAIQVLASRRTGASSDLVVESSRQMFTVLPAAMPVPIAYTARLDPDNPTLVVVAGRNLDGCWLDFGQNATVHTRHCDGDLVAALVSHSGGAQSTSSISIRNANNNSIGQYSMTVESPGAGSLSGTSGFGPGIGSDPLPAGPALNLTPVPNQQIVAATDQDSRVTSLNGAAVTSNFNLSAFAFTILDITIIVPIINRVHLIPHFDGGGNVLNDKIPARVGRLFPVRGAGLLLALRIEITIHIKVVVIIGFRFPFEDPSFPFNEFPDEFPDAFGSIVFGVVIQTQIFVNISSMVALVLPDGKLKVLSTFQLTLGIDFFIDFDNGHLHFDPHFIHKVTYRGISPVTNLLPCNGQFQLADDNGVTVFPDPFGGVQSFYFARAAGQCCVSWNFDLDLVRFEPGGPDQVIQSGLQLNVCVNAEPAEQLVDFIITSQPPPQGTPPTLTMNVGDSATLMVLMRPVDENGQPIPGPLQNAKDLGYGVGFYLELPADLLDPTLLPDGDAFAVQSGDNLIRASLTSLRVDDDQEPAFTFLPSAILGFDIARFVAIGELPRVRVGGLPVTVNVPASVKITPTLAFLDQNNNLVQTDTIVRNEPFEAAKEYVLAAKVNITGSVPLPKTFVFKVNSLAMSRSQPLAGLGFTGGRDGQQDIPAFFKGTLSQINQQVSLTISSASQLNKLILVQDGSGNHFSLSANNKEDLSTTPPSYVPPGRNVFGGSDDLALSITMSASENSAAIPLTNPTFNVKVINDETFEEYLRVFHEVTGILNSAPQNIKDFAQTFTTALNMGAPKVPSTNLLRDQGKRLWELATPQPPLNDDRPLYWARLQAICAIRAYCNRNHLMSSDAIVAQFEWPSRGLELNGSISFAGALTGRKVIVTGFDPFGLPGEPERANPSGIIALTLDRQPLVGVVPPVYVRTAVFPVRYKEFDLKIAENAVSPNLDSIVLLMTTSQNGGKDFYDIERWAGKNRAIATDNNRVHSPGDPISFHPAGGSTTIVSNLVVKPTNLGGPQFIETTLPYKPAITDRRAAQTLLGPTGDANNQTKFIFDKSYRVLETNATTRVDGEYHPEIASPLVPTPPDGFTVPDPTDQPDQTKTAFLGSGGNFLSNEIFYRTALGRMTNQPNLASGHLHVPPLTTSPIADQQARLIDGVKEALGRFLADRFLLKAPGTINFPKTPVTKTSAPIKFSAGNLTAHTLTAQSVVVDPPNTFAVTAKLPASIGGRKGSLSLAVTFTPQSVGVQNGTIMVLDSNGQALFSTHLSGEGIPLPPPPQITGFTPSSGTIGDTVTITGTNLALATAVRIGAFAFDIKTVSDTQITAGVMGPRRDGQISIDTPSGTATSDASFSVLVRRTVTL